MLTITTPFLIAGALGGASAIAITVRENFPSQNTEETKSNFFADLAKNIALGVFVPVAILGVIKGAVYLGIIPVASSLLTSFLALSIILKIAIPVLTIAAILSVVALSVFIYKKTRGEETVDDSQKPNQTSDPSVSLNVSIIKETKETTEETKKTADSERQEEILEFTSMPSEDKKGTEANPVILELLTQSTIVREVNALDDLLDATLDSIK